MTENGNNKAEGYEENPEGLFFQLFMSHQKSLYAFILASVRNYADANDILQETATVMWGKFGEFDKGTNFVGWGISISRNLIKKYFRERKMSRVQFDDKLFQDISEKVEKGLSKMDGRLEALKRCSQRLSDTARLLISMRYNEGMTIKAIASQLNRPVQGMYKAMARLQAALQRCIEKELAKEEI